MQAAISSIDAPNVGGKIYAHGGNAHMFRVLIAAALLATLTTGFDAWAAPPISDYAQEPGIQNVQLSPSGDHYAYTATTDGGRNLFIATADGQPPVAISIGSAHVSSIEWAGEDHLLVATRSLGKLGPGFTESSGWLTGITVINLKTNSSFRVFEHADPHVEPNVEGSFGARLIDGRWYGFFGGHSEDRPPSVTTASTLRDLYQVDLDTGALKRVSVGSDQGDDWLVGANGDVVARYQYNWVDGNWRLLAGASGSTTLASGRSQFGDGGSLGLGRTPDEILFERPLDKGIGSEFQMISLSGSPTVSVDNPNSLETPVFDRMSGSWLGMIEVTDRPEPRLFPPAFAAKIEKAFNAFPNQRPQLASFNEDLSKVIVRVSGGGESGAYYLVDLNTKKADAIGYAYPTIEPADVGTIRTIDYRASDGFALHGIVSLPPGLEAKDLPLVVLANDDVRDASYPQFEALAQAIASRGYAVFQPNTRGSYEYGRDLSAAAYGQLGRKIQTDMSDGVAALARQGVINPKRVCIVGARWGGYAALAGVTIQHGLYRCAISVGGYSDVFEAIFAVEDPSQSVNGTSRYLRALAGPAPVLGGENSAISPLRQAEYADAPILLIDNPNDPGDEVQQNDAMAVALGRAGKTFSRLSVSYAGNEIVDAPSRVTSMTAIVDFIEKYNPPVPPAPPAPGPKS